MSPEAEPLYLSMLMSKKRVHEIAKEQGVTSKELLDQAAARPASRRRPRLSSVEEDAALSALGAALRNGDGHRLGPRRRRPASAATPAHQPALRRRPRSGAASQSDRRTCRARRAHAPRRAPTAGRAGAAPHDSAPSATTRPAAPTATTAAAAVHRRAAPPRCGALGRRPADGDEPRPSTRPRRRAAGGPPASGCARRATRAPASARPAASDPAGAGAS